MRNAKNHILLLKQLKNTESAQLCKIKSKNLRPYFMTTAYSWTVITDDFVNRLAWFGMQRYGQIGLENEI